MELSEFIKNNKNTVGLIAIGLIIVFLFLCTVKSPFVSRKEGLCNPEFGGCKATYMEDGWGIQYPQQSIEPQDPYLTSSMVVPELPKNGIAAEKIKKNYLVEANKPYIHLEDDELNKALLPAPGFLFVGP
jgi:hypothetical protein